ncbi:hypothetical protein B6U99_06040 [Candidatus Geothermarchaeota archaeon ex4572_27]|nr:MAG: hypothetical protein B6U99_06040 [Candidatus Geothermarchaeota archaeon ex4572_27]
MSILFVSIGSGGQRILTEAYASYPSLRRGNFFVMVNTSASDHERTARRFEAANIPSYENVKPVVIGEGYGAGKDAELGLKMYEADRSKVVELVKEAHERHRFRLAFTVGSLGGGCASLAIAELSRDVAEALKVRVVPMVTLPFRREGRLIVENALRGLRRLSEYGFNPLVYDNELTLEFTRTVDEGVRLANHSFARLISTLIDVVECEDFAVPPIDIIDVTRIMIPQCGGFSTLFYDNVRDFTRTWREGLVKGFSLRSKVLTRSNAFLACKAKAFPQSLVEDIARFLRSRFNVAEMIPTVLERKDYVGYAVTTIIWGFSIDDIAPSLAPREEGAEQLRPRGLRLPLLHR